jgi:hypothetical protein
MSKILKFEKRIKTNYLWGVLIVSLLIHLSEGSLTAISYAQMEINNDPSDLKWFIAWFASIVAFLGIASISFMSAIMIPSTLRSAFSTRNSLELMIGHIGLFLVYTFMYLFMQYIFIVANLTLGNVIKTFEGIYTPFTFIWNDIDKESAATVTQARAASIAILIIYANIGFEVLLAISFLTLEVEEDIKAVQARIIDVKSKDKDDKHSSIPTVEVVDDKDKTQKKAIITPPPKHTSGIPLEDLLAKKN